VPVRLPRAAPACAARGTLAARRAGAARPPQAQLGRLGRLRAGGPPAGAKVAVSPAAQGT